MKVYVVFTGEVWESSSAEYVCSSEAKARSAALELLRERDNFPEWIVEDYTNGLAYWSDSYDYISIREYPIDAVKSRTAEYIDTRIAQLERDY